MAKRREPKITTGLYRYIIGIFEHFSLRGMNQKTAKIKAIDETYKVMRSVIEHDKDVPDYLVTVSAEHTVKLLITRGQNISKRLEVSKDPDEIELLRKSLREIKALVDSTNSFIERYKGEVKDEQ